MTNIDLKELCNEVCGLSKKVGKKIAIEAGKFRMDQVEVKGLNNFVSYVDKMAETSLVDGLRKLLPSAGYIVEEGTATHQGQQYKFHQKHQD